MNSSRRGKRRRPGISSLLQTVIRRLRRDCAGHRAVDCVPPNTLEGIFYDFATAIAGVIHAGQKINRAHGRVGELENRVDELIVLEGRRDVAAIDQLAVFERTTVKSVAAQFNALVPKGLTLVVVLFHVSTPWHG